MLKSIAAYSIASIYLFMGHIALANKTSCEILIHESQNEERIKMHPQSLGKEKIERALQKALFYKSELKQNWKTHPVIQEVIGALDPANKVVFDDKTEVQKENIGLTILFIWNLYLENSPDNNPNTLILRQSEILGLLKKRMKTPDSFFQTNTQKHLVGIISLLNQLIGEILNFDEIILAFLRSPEGFSKTSREKLDGVFRVIKSVDSTLGDKDLVEAYLRSPRGFSETSREKLDGVFRVIKSFDSTLSDKDLIEAYLRSPQGFSGTSREKLDGVFRVIKSFDSTLSDKDLIEAYLRSPEGFSKTSREKLDGVFEIVKKRNPGVSLEKIAASFLKRPLRFLRTDHNDHLKEEY